MPNSDRWIYLIFCHYCAKEYRDSFPPSCCDYCGSSDLSVAKTEGAQQPEEPEEIVDCNRCEGTGYVDLVSNGRSDTCSGKCGYWHKRLCQKTTPRKST